MAKQMMHVPPHSQDLRAEFSVPDMPVVVAETGNGWGTLPAAQ